MEGLGGQRINHGSFGSDCFDIDIDGKSALHRIFQSFSVPDSQERLPSFVHAPFLCHRPSNVTGRVPTQREILRERVKLDNFGASSFTSGTRAITPGLRDQACSKIRLET